MGCRTALGNGIGGGGTGGGGGAEREKCFDLRRMIRAGPRLERCVLKLHVPICSLAKC